ncbi:MAG TPA: hypothetical protein VLA82_13750 [Actinomycetota bacterium]|nr:hypothetical protein [Actinomycetota bacterium]
MRRSALLVSLVASIALVVLAPAAAAADVSVESVPRLQATPLGSKTCGGMEVVATDRNDIAATSTYDDRTLLSRTITQSQITVFEWFNAGTAIPIETLGSRTLTRNADGTYTLVLRGSGYWWDDGSLSGTPQLLRYTGTVRSVGELADNWTFKPLPNATTIKGVTASICEMLVAGLKARH